MNQTENDLICGLNLLMTSVDAVRVNIQTSCELFFIVYIFYKGEH